MQKQSKSDGKEDISCVFDTKDEKSLKTETSFFVERFEEY